MKPVAKPENAFKSIKRIFSYMYGYKVQLIIVIIAIVISSGASVAGTYFLKPVIDNLENAIKTGEWDKKSFVGLLGIMIGVYILGALCTFIYQRLLLNISTNTLKRIRDDLFNKMEMLPIRFFDKHTHGELMSRLTNDVDNISTTISNSLTLLLTYSFTIVGILVMMLVLSVRLTLVTLAGVVLIFVLTKVVTEHTGKLFAVQQKNLGILNGQIEEGISGLSLVKAFCREKQMAEDFERKNEDLRKVSVKAQIWSGTLMPVMNVINNLCYVAIAVFSGILYVNGKISGIGNKPCVFKLRIALGG